MQITMKVMEVKIVQMSELIANDYNPNRMPKTEMKLLADCMIHYGFLFPIVATWDDGLKKFRIIDGYHRFETLRQLGCEFVAIIDLQIPYEEAVQLTVLMNRIKGLHQVERMSDLIVKLEDLGLNDDEICKNLGMETEEYLRLRQQLGIAHAFREHKYTKSWELTK